MPAEWEQQLANIERDVAAIDRGSWGPDWREKWDPYSTLRVSEVQPTPRAMESEE